MLNFLLIFICLAAGYFIKKFKRLPDDSYKSVNAWVVNIALPAVALKYIPQIEWDASLLLPFAMPFIVWAGSYLFVQLVSRFIAMDLKTKAALFLTAGLGNTSFLGFPLTEAYYGAEGLKIAILCDQACFIVMATFGIMTATRASNEGRFSIAPILRKIFLFPPFIAFCLAFLLPHLVSLAPIEPLLTGLALTLVPLALFSVGLQLQLRSWREDARLLSVALTYKLCLAPLLVLLVGLALGLTDFIAKISIFEAGMAPMVTGVIIATDYNLNPKLANIILSIGIPLSLVTTFFWHLILQFL